MTEPLSHSEPVALDRTSGTPGEVFRVFLKLGCTSFGGPVAHLGYFQAEFVQKRRWLDAFTYADLVGLCQFLPGPASSQVGLAIGQRRAGWRGALCAWLGFTMPSAAAMTAFALMAHKAGVLGNPGWIQGLQLAAIAVVVQAILQMARTLCPDLARAAIAVAVATALMVVEGAWAAPLAIAMAAVVGGYLVKIPPPASAVCAGSRSQSSRSGWACLAVFFGLSVILPLLAGAVSWRPLWVADAFYRSGAWVFGGGHVVLPLLEQATVARGWLPEDLFLAGYGAAQAVPGPLFSVSCFLGALIPPGGVAGALLALVFLYLPGALVLFGTLPFWDRVRTMPWARRWIAGANAAVVGLLLSALTGPIGDSAVVDFRHFAFVVVAFVLLWFAKLPPWLLVGLCAGAGAFCF